VRQTKEPDRSGLTDHFSKIIDLQQEIYIKSIHAVKHKSFARLGLTDSALARANGAETVLLTVDYDLYVDALNAGREVINFIHYRENISPR
jgi:hypothetical protein